MIQIVILSPSPAMQAGLRALVAADPDLAVAAVAPTLADLPPALPPIDVVLATPEGAGLGPLPQNPLRLPDLPGALLLVTGDPALAAALREAGLPAWGALSPEAPAEALQAAIHALAEGLVVFSPELAAEVEPVPGLAGRPASTTGRTGIAAAENLAGGGLAGDEDGVVEPLTARESEVLRGLAQGLTNKQIALALGISEHTVKFHVSAIYSKMGAANRTEAVRKGARRGWVPL